MRVPSGCRRESFEVEISGLARKSVALLVLRNDLTPGGSPAGYTGKQMAQCESLEFGSESYSMALRSKG